MKKSLFLGLCIVCNYAGFFFAFLTVGQLMTGAWFILLRGTILASAFFVAGRGCLILWRSAEAENWRTVQITEIALFFLLLSVEVFVFFTGGA